MERITISMPEKLLERLIAGERRTSMAALIREAVEERVWGHRPRPRSLGVGFSGHRDTARRTAEERADQRHGR